METNDYLVELTYETDVFLLFFTENLEAINAGENLFVRKRKKEGFVLLRQTSTKNRSA